MDELKSISLDDLGHFNGIVGGRGVAFKVLRGEGIILN